MKVGLHTRSAGHLIDSLVQRRVLSQDEGGVGFRHAALLYLFAAKWMLEDADFASLIRAAPLRYAPIVVHAAGLRRNAADLLRLAGDLAEQAIAAVGTTVSVGQFNLMTG